MFLEKVAHFLEFCGPGHRLKAEDLVERKAPVHFVELGTALGDAVRYEDELLRGSELVV